MEDDDVEVAVNEVGLQVPNLGSEEQPPKVMCDFFPNFSLYYLLYSAFFNGHLLQSLVKTVYVRDVCEAVW